MKRAKIALTAIGLFAIVGGALAFKSYRNTDIYCRIAAAPGACTTTLFNSTFNPTTTTGGLTTYCTFSPLANCNQTATLIRPQQ